MPGNSKLWRMHVARYLLRMMSRSRKREPYCGNTKSESEKLDKRLANRRLRRRNRSLLVGCDEFQYELEEISDIWVFAKDGKHRFDPVEQPELLRK